MRDGKNPSRLSLALAAAATQEIGNILQPKLGEMTEPDKKRVSAILARYIEMVR